MSSLQLSSDGKSSYMQTCNLLSQYLNGKAALKDIINLGINGDGEIAGIDFFFFTLSASCRNAQSKAAYDKPLRSGSSPNPAHNGSN